jgi:PAS domain S-box-containing protein
VLVVTSDITERKRAEEALRASEERYRRLFEGDLAGDYVSTPAGKLIACNAAFARIFRFKSIDDALATNTHELYPNPEARQLFLRSLRQNRRLELREAWLKRRDGTDLHVIENSFSVFDDKGELIEIRGYLLDDTERKRAEEELQRSEMQYRSLTENSPDLIARFDRQYCHLYVNPTAAEAGRCSPHEYVGKTIAESGVPEEEARKWEERIRTVFETGQVVDVEDSFETPKGSRNFHTKFVPEFAPDGSIHSVQSIARDITERKQAEKALQKSEERYRSLFANMLDGFAYCKMIFDDQNRPVDFVYLAVNRAFEQLSGLKDVEGKRISEVLPDVKESSPELLERYGRVALTGKPEQFEFSLKSLNQRLSISVYSTEKGYFVAVFENITERRRAEERRITSQEQLRQLAGHLQSVREEERKHLSQEFHDQLGQTLTALKMDLALLQRELADKTREVSPSTLGEKIQSMQGLIDTGIQAIREIMSELHPELLDQLGLVAALEWEAERFQKRSSLKCQFTSELEELPFDPKKSIALFRIFQEAVTNVARHAQATIVEISVRREGDDVVLEIRDNGIGIEPNAEHKARSFGLVGMRERAVLLGGTLEITGIKGRGTTILVRMPFEQTLPDGGAAL